MLHISAEIAENRGYFGFWTHKIADLTAAKSAKNGRMKMPGKVSVRKGVVMEMLVIKRYFWLQEDKTIFKAARLQECKGVPWASP